MSSSVFWISSSVPVRFLAILSEVSIFLFVFHFVETDWRPDSEHEAYCPNSKSSKWGPEVLYNNQYRFKAFKKVTRGC